MLDPEAILAEADLRRADAEAEANRAKADATCAEESARAARDLVAQAYQRIGELEPLVAALDSAQDTIAQLEVRLASAAVAAQREHDLRTAAEDGWQQAVAELARTHEMYAAAFGSRSWRWTRLMRRERRSKA